MKIYDFILQDHEATPDNAYRAVFDTCWDEIEQTEQDKPQHSRFIDSAEGIDTWYDYGADYYFFTDTQPEVTK